MSKTLKCLFASFIAIVSISIAASAEENQKPKEGQPGTVILKDGTKIEAKSITESYSVITTADKEQIIRRADVQEISKKDGANPKLAGLIILKAVGAAPSVAIEAKSITESYSIITIANKEQTIIKTNVEKIAQQSNAEVIPLDRKKDQ